MTAEIVIINKNAVALAADSAVTIKNPQTQKVYNTANKLFMLSKYHPVGVMVYGTANFMGVPWETVIKIYRDELSTNSCGHLVEYADGFLSFIENSRLLFPEKLQANVFGIMCRYPLWGIRNRVDERVKSRIADSGGISDDDVEIIVNEVVNEFTATWAADARLPCFPETFEADLVDTYREIIDFAIKEILVNLPVQPLHDQLRQVCALAVTRDRWTPDSGGFVVAGFGRGDIFPVVRSYGIEAVVRNKLKFAFREAQSNDVNESNRSMILPLAQGEIVYRFIQGIDPEYKRELTNFLRSILSVQYPNDVLERVAGNISDTEKTDLRDHLTQLGNGIVENFWEKWTDWEHNKFVGPVLDIVGDLPKDDLAAMAESLVNLTSFKRRISPEMETVGGPIDVAVISKGDGFIWIKRKHYFSKELNPGFLTNYYRRG